MHNRQVTETACHTLDAIQAAHRAVARAGLSAKDLAALRIEYDDGVISIAGEVGDITLKRRVLKQIAVLPGVIGIADRLHVRPAVSMSDKEIRNHVRDALVQEPALLNIDLYEVAGGVDVVVRDLGSNHRGDIHVSVEHGVVLLDGDVPGLAQKRLAGVLAWWVPGSRDVINGLGTMPMEQDNDAEITESVRIALEKDPFVDASRITVMTHDREVRLEGMVPTSSERHMAEMDAWYVSGVDDVFDYIKVGPCE